MAKTLGDVRTEVLTRLGDTTQAVWSSDEIDGYITEGYDHLAELTNCFWDLAYLENLPYTGDHTCLWEIEYLAAGDQYYNEFKYTADWEIEFINNAVGPANHVAPWEWQDGYVALEYILATAKLPADLYRIERATNNWKEIEPISSNKLESDDRVYETEKGVVIGYLQDKDGLRTFRKFKVPSSKCDYYSVTGSWGILRDCSDITGEEIQGNWGIPRKIPNQHPIGPERFGLPRRVYQDGNNVRIEYFRRGRELTESWHEFEMQDVYCKYIRHYAMWKALARNGPGQDLKLSQHYQHRFAIGLERIRGRKVKAKSNRVGQFGGTAPRGVRPPKPRLPWQYGRVAQ